MGLVECSRRRGQHLPSPDPGDHDPGDHHVPAPAPPGPFALRVQEGQEEDQAGREGGRRAYLDPHVHVQYKYCRWPDCPPAPASDPESSAGSGPHPGVLHHGLG